jgi:hypothetical protein
MFRCVSAALGTNKLGVFCYKTQVSSDMKNCAKQEKDGQVHKSCINLFLQLSGRKLIFSN